jgi:hypothetical protein
LNICPSIFACQNKNDFFIVINDIIVDRQHVIVSIVAVRASASYVEFVRWRIRFCSMLIHWRLMWLWVIAIVERQTHKQTSTKTKEQVANLIGTWSCIELAFICILLMFIIMSRQFPCKQRKKTIYLFENQWELQTEQSSPFDLFSHSRNRTINFMDYLTMTQYAYFFFTSFFVKNNMSWWIMQGECIKYGIVSNENIFTRMGQF